jgi:hypothetical protein
MSKIEQIRQWARTMAMLLGQPARAGSGASSSSSSSSSSTSTPSGPDAKSLRALHARLSEQLAALRRLAAPDSPIPVPKHRSGTPEALLGSAAGLIDAGSLAEARPLLDELKDALDTHARLGQEAARHILITQSHASEVKRLALKTEMETQLNGKPRLDAGQLTALRSTVALEFARDDEQAGRLKAADALGLAKPPSPAKQAFDDNTGGLASFWTAEVCFEAFKKYTWFDFKRLRKSKERVSIPRLAGEAIIEDDVMWKLYQFRRRYVDARIAELNAEIPGLLFKSAGSEDIESDLDITVASPGSGDDVKAMRRFNLRVNTDFGRPPGRVFDTNLYARDYNAIKDNMTQGRDAAHTAVDADIAEPLGAVRAIANIDQDVATLMKQRRFLDGVEFTRMWQALCDSIKPAGYDGLAQPDRERIDAQQQTIQLRFEEAEAIYLLTSVEKVEAIMGRIEAQIEAQAAGKTGRDADPRLQDFDARKAAFLQARAGADSGRAGALGKFQVMLPEFLDFLEERFEDQVMAATDDLYADRMAQLREDQVALDSMEKTLAGHRAVSDAACRVVHPGVDHADFERTLAETIAAHKARAKQAQFTNIIFANEAYVSQGAIQHIVAGKQAGDPQTLAKIQPAELLQSTNEQVADFLKDMKHMQHAEKAAAGNEDARRRASGEAFVHASKYLARMLEAVAMLEGKYQGQPAVLEQLTTPRFTLLAAANLESAGDLQKNIEDFLLKLRKSSTIPGDAKAELAVSEVMRLFGVGSIDGLRDKILEFSREFNQRVRLMESFQADQRVSQAALAQYGEAARDRQQATGGALPKPASGPVEGGASSPK